MKRGGFLFFSIVSLLTAVAPVGMQAQEKKHENALQERQALPTTIMGTVIDSEANEPLPGATVRFKGTNVGVVTDKDGRFRMTVPQKGRVIVVSFVGKQPVEITLKAKTTQYRVLLTDQYAVSNEVVVTGYRSITKTRMTGASESVTSKEIANKGFSSVGDILRGTLGGVSTRLTSGKL